MTDVRAPVGPSDTWVQTGELYQVHCVLCFWTATETGLIAASTLVFLHKMRCCVDTHVCVRPAARRWTPLGNLETRAIGSCLDCASCCEF